jgi:hypothetical protein
MNIEWVVRRALPQIFLKLIPNYWAYNKIAMWLSVPQLIPILSFSFIHEIIMDK